MNTKLLLVTLTILATVYACTSADKNVVDIEQTILTVIKLDNQNPRFEYKTDTLIKSQIIDLSEKKVDLFFCFRSFRIPNYMPTRSIYKDSIKDNECNWNNYPNTVKCYEYDSKNRVIKMQVEGSGTTGSHTFIYDDQDRIIEMNSHSGIYRMTYDKEGNLLLMTVDGGSLQKQLKFIYDTK